VSEQLGQGSRCPYEMASVADDREGDSLKCPNRYVWIDALTQRVREKGPVVAGEGLVVVSSCESPPLLSTQVSYPSRLVE
jgi:hypothetical protein